MSQEKSVLIHPAKTLAGSIRLPGDKSISHRYAMLGATAEGSTKLENFSTGADCASTLGCIRALGVKVERSNGSVLIEGRGAKLQSSAGPLDCGNSGSTIRMLSGILAGQEFTSELIGDESLSRRPMSRVMTPLTAMGAKLEARDGARPPLRITGGRLKAIDYKMPVPSAQVKSAVLFAGLFAEGETIVSEPVCTRDHGEQALAAFGAEVKRQGNEIRIEGGQKLRAIEADIPSDISSAAFFLCAAALFPGSQVVIGGLLLNPTRARMLDILISMGVGISVTQLEEQYGELRGTVQIQGGAFDGATIKGADTTAL